MKHFFLIISLGLLCFNCHPLDKRSMFLYMPESIASLRANGYNVEQGTSDFWKTIGDTTERINIQNLDSGQFSKSFYIRIKSTKEIRLTDFIVRAADSVLLNLEYSLLVKIKGRLFHISCGYSGKKTRYSVNYRNIARFGDKVVAVNILRTDLEHYLDTATRQLILNALNRIDKNWQHLPTEYYEGPPPPSDSQRS